MNNSQSKTRGVLAAEEIEVIYARWHCGSAIGLARDIEAAVLAKTAPQSPVAPADERAAFEATFPPFGVDWDGTKYVGREGYENSYRVERFMGQHEGWQARARLADAPTVSATAKGGWLSELVDTRNGEVLRTHFSVSTRMTGDHGIDDCEWRSTYLSCAAPTPPTSAADAGQVRDVGFVVADGKHVPTVLIEFPIEDWESRDKFAAAIAASKKESGDE